MNDVTISVQEDVEIGTVVYVAAATDIDSGENGLVSSLLFFVNLIMTIFISFIY